MSAAPAPVNLHFGLLAPAWLGLTRGITRRHPRLLSLLILAGMALMTVGYWASFRFLRHILKAPLVGEMLVGRLLEMILLSMFFMIFFSSIIAAFSVFFLDDELHLLFTTPCSTARIFWSRFLRVVIESSWMAMAFFLPIFYGFLSALKSSWHGFVLLPPLLMIFITLPNLLGAALSLTLARFFPIRQTKKVFQFLGMVVLVGIIFLFRVLEIEKLLNPSHFERVSNYIFMLQTPILDYFPSAWLKAGIEAIARGDYPLAATQLWPMFAIAVFAGLLMTWLAQRHYLYGWQSALEAVDNQVRSLELIRSVLIFPLRLTSRDFRVIAEKEITTVLRDPAMLSQVFMMCAILAVYYYNLRILPLRDLSSLLPGATIHEEIYMWNNGFVGFILAALAMRFVFPSMSLEGRAFWVTRTAPIRPSRLMWVKFLLYVIPMTIIGMSLFVLGRAAFGVTSPFLVGLSCLNTLLMALVITALAIGVGALHARYDSDNPLRIAGSFGGLVFMLLSGIYVVLMLFCEIYPLWRYFVFRYYDFISPLAWNLIGASVVLLLMFTLAWILIPLRLGARSIDRYEPE